MIGLIAETAAFSIVAPHPAPPPPIEALVSFHADPPERAVSRVEREIRTGRMSF